MRARQISIVAIFASLYVVLCVGLAPISYGEINIRIADALYPLIALFNLPALIGLVLGHFIANLYSPLGLLDLVSVLVFIPAKIAIWKLGFKAVPIHVLSVALWVPAMLYSLYGVPYFITVLYVGLGESFAELILGRWLYLEIKKRMKQ